jgi:WD40 repeat protein
MSILSRLLGRPLRELTNDRVIRCLAFSKDGQKLITGDHWGFVKVWDVRSGAMDRVFLEGPAGIDAVTLSGDGNILAVGMARRTYNPDVQETWIQLWNFGTGQLTRTVVWPGSWSAKPSFSRDNRFVASAVAGHRAVMWDLSTGEAVRVFTGHRDWVSGAVFSPAEDILATGSADRTLRLWDAGSGVNQLTLKTRAEVAALKHTLESYGEFAWLNEKTGAGVRPDPSRHSLTCRSPDS